VLLDGVTKVRRKNTIKTDATVKLRRSRMFIARGEHNNPSSGGAKCDLIR
jgi:hypothetical protein